MKELEDLLEAVSAWDADERARVDAAAAEALRLHEGKPRASGEPAVTHPLRNGDLPCDLLVYDIP